VALGGAADIRSEDKMPKLKKTNQKNNKQESIEATLWQTANKLRKNMDAAEYKHVVLGLIFLKYISDVFEDLHFKLVEGKGEYEGADPEDPNEYTAEKVFFVPPVARWKRISDNAKKTKILLDLSAGSFTPRGVLSRCWLICSNLTKAGYSTPAAAQAACLFRAKSLSSPIRTTTSPHPRPLHRPA
jgi:hypothetical protein